MPAFHTPHWQRRAGVEVLNIDLRTPGGSILQGKRGPLGKF